MVIRMSETYSLWVSFRGAPQGASPESITTARAYGFRARRFALRRSLEILMFFGRFHTLFHTFCLAQHGPACPDFTGLTGAERIPRLIVAGNRGSPLRSGLFR